VAALCVGHNYYFSMSFQYLIYDNRIIHTVNISVKVQEAIYGVCYTYTPLSCRFSSLTSFIQYIILSIMSIHAKRNTNYAQHLSFVICRHR
jgi:hypothetical protein